MLRKALVTNTQRLSCGVSSIAVRTAPAFLSLRPSAAATAVATAPAVTTTTNHHRRHYHEKDKFFLYMI
jgi:hypothetical protein